MNRLSVPVLGLIMALLIASCAETEVRSYGGAGGSTDVDTQDGGAKVPAPVEPEPEPEE